MSSKTEKTQTQALTVVPTPTPSGRSLSPLAAGPQTFEQAMSFATKLAGSTFVPKAFRGNAGDILAAVLTGAELGISPMQSLQSIHVVDGKPLLSSQLIVAIVKASPLCEYFICTDTTTTSATWAAKRHGEPERKGTFTVEDAKRAGLGGRGAWSSYPAVMLRWRAATNLAREVFPDLLLGVVADTEEDEVRGHVAPPRGDVVDATFEPAPPPPPAKPAPKKGGKRAAEEWIAGEEAWCAEHPVGDSAVFDEWAPELGCCRDKAELAKVWAAVETAKAAGKVPELEARHLRLTCGKLKLSLPDVAPAEREPGSDDE